MHVLVLASLAAAVVQTHRAATDQPVNACVALPVEAAGLDAAGIDESFSEALRRQTAEGAAAIAAATATPTQSTTHVLAPTPLEIEPHGLMLGQACAPKSIDLVSIDRPDDAEQEPLGAAGVPAAAGGKDGQGHSFFGLQTSGEKVVFVVDISGSMKGRRFFRARSELERSIESLRADQQFFVIFFNGDALPMPSDKLLPATPSNVSQTIQWIKYVECGGGTNPLPGLMQAIALRPDAIYLLTDGKFDPQTVWEVSQAEPVQPIPIYTISFASRSAEKLLKAIAKETGGVYRFVK